MYIPALSRLGQLFRLFRRRSIFGCMMRRVRGIARAVVTIAGAISLSSPLPAASSGAAHVASVRQKDRQDIVKGEFLIPLSLADDEGGLDKPDENMMNMMNGDKGTYHEVRSGKER